MGKRNKSSIESQTNAHNLAERQKIAFFEILSYCLFIIISPITTFFASKHFIYDSIFDPIPSNIWAAISAVIILHIALGLFLYKAYFSGDDPKPSRKQD